jgi:regulator of protease activity HflC (stomatin/prohibitin superfamily)
MIWILITILLVGVGVAALLAGRHITEPTGHEDGGTYKPYKRVGMLVGVGCLSLWGVFTLFASIQTIDPGHVGLVKQFGSITGRLDNGLSFVPPWADVVDLNVQEQRTTFSSSSTKSDYTMGTAGSSDTQLVDISETISYRVNPDDAIHLYTTVGAAWFDKLVPPRIAQATKDVISRYKAVDLLPHREDVRAQVLALVQQRLSPYSVQVVDVNMTNIGFSASFSNAIEAKVEAQQRAQQAQNEVAISQAQAQQAVATADGQAKALLAVANAQSQANKELAASVTPEFVAYQNAINLGKLADKATGMQLVPSNAFLTIPK